MRVDMTQLLDSMEESIKSQHRARARKRAEKEKAELMAFQEKLRRAGRSLTPWRPKSKAQTPPCRGISSLAYA